MANKVTCYDDEAVCQDLARADDSIKDIAAKHNVSAGLLYKIASGATRPALKVRIDELIAAEQGAGMRLAKSRARWAVGRLVQIASQNEDLRAAKYAIDSILEMGGMLTADGSADEKQTIEIILSAGKDGDDPLKRRITGVSNLGGSN